MVRAGWRLCFYFPVILSWWAPFLPTFSSPERVSLLQFVCSSPHLDLTPSLIISESPLPLAQCLNVVGMERWVGE